MVRSIGNPEEWAAPEGCAYWPEQEFERPPQGAGQVWGRLPDLAADGVVLIRRGEWVDPEPDPIPESVPMARFRIALRKHGIDPAVISAYLAEYPDALDEWEYQAFIERSYPLIPLLAQVFGRTDEQVDAIFVEAGKMGALQSL